MCPKCCPKYLGYRSLRFFQQHSCNSVYMCVFLHVGSERFLPILKRVGKVLYYESLSLTFARKDVYKALFSKTWSRVSEVGCLKRSGFQDGNRVERSRLEGQGWWKRLTPVGLPLSRTRHTCLTARQ